MKVSLTDLIEKSKVVRNKIYSNNSENVRNRLFFEIPSQV